MASLWPAIPWPTLAAFWYSKAWRLKLVAIDQYPGTKLGPVIGHDLELSRDGLQLARACVGYFYFELFQSNTTMYCLGKYLRNQSIPARTMSQASNRSAPMIVS